MTTTSQGLPLYAQTDSADIATKFNANMNAVDALLPISRQMARTAVLSMSEATWTAVNGYGAGALYNVPASSGVSYPGSGVLQVDRAGLYRWSLTALWTEKTSAEFRGVKIQVNGSDATWSQGAHFGYFGSSGGGGTPFPWTAGGEIVLATSDQVQAFCWSSGTGTGNSIAANGLVFTLVRVG